MDSRKQTQHRSVLPIPDQPYQGTVVYALCSPTRAALLTGRNHHAVGMGGITEIATSARGYNSIHPNSAVPLAEMLRLNGCATAQFGKCHELPAWEVSPMGPFDHIVSSEERMRVAMARG